MSGLSGVFLFVCRKQKHHSLQSAHARVTHDTGAQAWMTIPLKPVAAQETVTASRAVPKPSQVHVCNCFFYGVQNFALPAAGVFPRSRLRCTQGTTCTPRCRCESRPGSAARALGVQSRQIGQVMSGLLSFRSARTNQAHLAPWSHPRGARLSSGLRSSRRRPASHLVRKQQNTMLHLQLASNSRS